MGVCTQGKGQADVPFGQCPLINDDDADGPLVVFTTFANGVWGLKER